MVSIHSIVGVAIVVVLVALVHRRDDDRGGSERSGEIAEGVVDGAEPTGADWCSLLERTCNASVLCFDNTLQLVSMGLRAESISNGVWSRTSRVHLMDVVPRAAQAKLIEAAAAARRGVESTAKVVWDGIELDATCVGISCGWVAIIFSNGGDLR